MQGFRWRRALLFFLVTQTVILSAGGARFLMPEEMGLPTWLDSCVLVYVVALIMRLPRLVMRRRSRATDRLRDEAIYFMGFVLIMLMLSDRSDSYWQTVRFSVLWFTAASLVTGLPPRKRTG